MVAVTGCLGCTYAIWSRSWGTDHTSKLREYGRLVGYSILLVAMLLPVWHRLFWYTPAPHEKDLGLIWWLGHIGALATGGVVASVHFPECVVGHSVDLVCRGHILMHSSTGVGAWSQYRAL